jgi:hypothetical protein
MLIPTYRKNGSGKTTEHGACGKGRGGNEKVCVDNIVNQTQLSRMSDKIQSVDILGFLTKIQAMEKVMSNPAIIGTQKEILGYDVHLIYELVSSV